MNLNNTSPTTKRYSEDKGGMFKNYNASLILDTSYSCFNALSTTFSSQILRLIISSPTSIDYLS